MDIGRHGRSQKNVGQWLRLMSVWALSLWPLRIWQEQSQAGVTASIHLLVSCNRAGAFVQKYTCTNTQQRRHTAHPAACVFYTFCRQGCTHAHTHTGARQQTRQVCAHIFRHTDKKKDRPKKRKNTLPGKLQRVSFQEGVVLWCWLPSNVCKLSCPIMGDKWHVGLRLCPDSFAPAMTTISLKCAHLCWWMCKMIRQALILGFQMTLEKADRGNISLFLVRLKIFFAPLKTD